jgi:dihydrofolate reductase
MRKLVVVEFVTLDGVMQSLGSPDEDREGGFEHGGWAGPYMDEAQTAAAVEGLAATTAYLFGRKTYEHLAAFWPTQSGNPMAEHLNATRKYVATRTLHDLTWANAEVLPGELEEAVAGLRAGGDGNLVVLGSGVLVAQLIDAGLVDEYQLFVHPLVLGTGKRLFTTTREPQRLRLIDVTPTTTGVLMVSYATA